MPCNYPFLSLEKIAHLVNGIGGTSFVAQYPCQGYSVCSSQVL